ncbi:hypothetical protein [Pseudomonas sp. GD03944]|uniref:hypothetical protein n=1 Tax=Pseudomonas sp. GD03944 TaxID=2975409 RepID=UPI002448ACF1|nr:hypothetical protein [Pseudomonas sp. GD03944]MDH1263705.1 hypothetical protein [Pseudomonas sp. GD03944]
MGKAKQVTWENDTLNGEQGCRYRSIFLSTFREHHIGLHTIMDANRQGEHPHGMWIYDTSYPNIDEMIWAYAARACRRIERNSHHIITHTLQHNGRLYYRLRLSTTANVGIADAEGSRNLQPRIKGFWYTHTQFADIVFEPRSTTDNGHHVYSIVTFFPVSPPSPWDHGTTAQFFEAKDYSDYQKNRHRW